jgi:hypothetical protein
MSVCGLNRFQDSQQFSGPARVLHNRTVDYLPLICAKDFIGDTLHDFSPLSPTLPATAQQCTFPPSRSGNRHSTTFPHAESTYPLPLFIVGLEHGRKVCKFG